MTIDKVKSKEERPTERKPRKSKGEEPSSVVVGLAAVDDISDRLRSDLVVKKLIKAFKKSPMYKTPYKGTIEEVSAIAKELKKMYKIKEMELGDIRALKIAAVARLKIQRRRDRVTEIMIQLRELNYEARKVWKVGSCYVSQSSELNKFSVSAKNNILEATLIEISNVTDYISSILDSCMSLIYDIDAHTRAIDDWHSLFKQYVFMSGMTSTTKRK